MSAKIQPQKSPTELNEILRLFKWPASSNPGKMPHAIKLNFRDISQIGQVDPLYHLIEELSLNNNQLQSLDGIEQFKYLKSLSLNSNNIHSITELAKVTKRLLSLDLKQNPRCLVTKEYLLEMFPLLTKFNGVVIRNFEQTPDHSCENSVQMSTIQSSIPSNLQLKSCIQKSSSYKAKRQSCDAVRNFNTIGEKSSICFSDQQSISRIINGKPPIAHNTSYLNSSIQQESQIESQQVNKYFQNIKTESQQQLFQPSMIKQDEESNADTRSFLFYTKTSQSDFKDDKLDSFMSFKIKPLLLKTFKAWKQLTKRRKDSEDAIQESTQVFSSDSSLETHHARLRFKEMCSKTGTSRQSTSTDLSVDSPKTQVTYKKISMPKQSIVKFQVSPSRNLNDFAEVCIRDEEQIKQLKKKEKQIQKQMNKKALPVISKRIEKIVKMLDLTQENIPKPKKYQSLPASTNRSAVSPNSTSKITLSTKQDSSVAKQRSVKHSNTKQQRIQTKQLQLSTRAASKTSSVDKKIKKGKKIASSSIKSIGIACNFKSSVLQQPAKPVEKTKTKKLISARLKSVMQNLGGISQFQTLKAKKGDKL